MLLMMQKIKSAMTELLQAAILASLFFGPVFLYLIFWLKP
jgi:hypothetical protein